MKLTRKSLVTLAQDIAENIGHGLADIEDAEAKLAILKHPALLKAAPIIMGKFDVGELGTKGDQYVQTKKRDLQFYLNLNEELMQIEDYPKAFEVCTRYRELRMAFDNAAACSDEELRIAEELEAMQRSSDYEWMPVADDNIDPFDYKAYMKMREAEIEKRKNRK